MANSGYVMVDATGIEIYDDDPQTIDGIYAKLTAAVKTGKSVKLANTSFDGMPLSPVDATVAVDEANDDNIVVTWHVYRATVEADDTVTVLNLTL